MPDAQTGAAEQGTRLSQNGRHVREVVRQDRSAASTWFEHAESGKAGAVYNGAGGDIALREFAEAVAAGSPGVSATSYTPERAAEAWGAFPAMLLAINNRVSGARARTDLGWAPYATQPALAIDLARGSYAASARDAAA